MIQPAIFTTALALAFAAVLALVLFSGRLSAGRRRQLELAMVWLILPLLTGLWAWQTYLAVKLGSGLLIAGQLVIGALVAIQIFRAVRKHRSARTQP
jgi:hypothetical protein